MINRFHNCNAYVETVPNGLVFWSYRTRIAHVEYVPGDTPIIHVGPCFDCSATTRKQFGRFLREYVPGVSYGDIKALSRKGYVDCQPTGELLPIRYPSGDIAAYTVFTGSTHNGDYYGFGGGYIW